MPNIDFTQLLPEVKTVIEYVGISVTGGIIGNRADAWFVNLYYHQKQRLVSWLNGWKMSDEDRVQIENNEDMRILFSNVTASVTNEIFDKKLLIWPTITESLLRNKDFEFNEKLYFINVFMKSDPFAIQYLAMLETQGPIDSSRIFPHDLPGNRPALGQRDFAFFLGHLQNAANGMIIQVSEDQRVVFKISELGSRFIEFISNSSEDDIRRMAEDN